MTPELKGVYEDEVEKFDRLLIAAESWAKTYKKDRTTYKRIVSIEARLRRQIRGLFRDQSAKIDGYINWNQYAQQLAQVNAAVEEQALKGAVRVIVRIRIVKAAVDIEVIVNDDFYDELDGLFFTLTFETISTAIATGAQAGEAIYKIPLGIRSTDATIQQLTTERLAYLFGKRVDKSGNVVDNPRAEYRISDKTRQNIASNIKTGIALGEDKQTMTKRLTKVIQDPTRAERIAQTETVNAYGEGMLDFGRESNATGKEWEDVAATDVCADNAAQGVISLEDVFVSGDSAPAAHTGCRCNLRIVYSNEFPG